MHEFQGEEKASTEITLHINSTSTRKLLEKDWPAPLFWTPREEEGAQGTPAESPAPPLVFLGA